MRIGSRKGMLSYARLEEWVPGYHLLRAIRTLVDAALVDLSPAVEALYARVGRWFFVLTATAYNLIRIPKLLAAG